MSWHTMGTLSLLWVRCMSPQLVKVDIIAEQEARQLIVV